MISQRVTGVFSTLFNGGVQPCEPLSAYERSCVLRRVCAELREGTLKRAEMIVRCVGERGDHDPVCLNLLGVLHEARREWRQARRFYGKAIRAEGRFEPARQNLRRLYELHTFGTSGEPVAVGDLDTDLWFACHMKQGRKHT